MTRDELLALAARVEAARAEDQRAVLEEVFSALGQYSQVFRWLDTRAFLDAADWVVARFWQLLRLQAREGRDE